ASAHFELACLFDQKEADPAEAIHHYNCYLKLRPKAENSDLVKQHILTCKQELARTVSLGPVTEKVQRELEQLTEENKRLTEENKRLHEDLDRWSANARGVQMATNRSAVATQPNRQTQAPVPVAAALAVEAQSTSTGAPRVGSANAPGARTHTVKA